MNGNFSTLANVSAVESPPPSPPHDIPCRRIVGVKILHLAENMADAVRVRELVLREWPECAITPVNSRAAFAAELGRADHDLVLADCTQPDLPGLAALALVRELAADTPVIFLAGPDCADRMAAAVAAGAQDYVWKDRLGRLTTAITNALRERAERRKRDEAEMRSREFADYLNQAREAIIVTNLEGRITFWNRGAARLFGWRSEEVLNRTAGEIFDPAIKANAGAANEETLAKGEWFGELRMRNRTGHELIVESRQTLIRDGASQPKARLSINSDITDRKRLEEQFLRSQRMEGIGLLASGIAHDLNNMLAPILLASSMLREHVSDPAAIGLLGTLEKSAERGANLVRQIVAFAHGTTGEHRSVQVKHLLRDIAAVVAGTFPKSIRFEDRVASDLCSIRGNPTQVHQVLLNLCVNARDAMPHGGTLRLRAENRVLSLGAAEVIAGARPGVFVVLHVEDTGTGIPPEVLARMWEPFFTTKEAGKGTGLGLATVRGIVENHRGFVEVSTAPGVGSAFRIFLPGIEGEETEKLVPAARALPPGKGELILIVDDERQIRDMLTTMLTRNGYRAIVAPDGAAATVIFAQRAAEIKLVITDLHMPHLDGAMLGRALRRLNPDTKVLVVSGLSSSLGNRPPFKPEEFADGFLHKPFKTEALLGKVHELLHGTGTAVPAPAS